MPGDRELPNSAAQRERIRAIVEHGPTGRLRHCLTIGIQIHGEADVDEFRRRLIRLVKRRPALGSVFSCERTHYLTHGAEPHVVQQHVQAPTAEARWALATHIADFEAERPFRLGEHPLVRGLLLTAERDRHLLVVCLDQLVSDAWSANLVVNDLLAEDTDETPDAYPTVWRQREQWLDGPAGQAAVRRRREHVADAWRRWPIEVEGGTSAPDDTVEHFIAVDDTIAMLLQDKVRRMRGSMLAVGALALALSVAEDAAPPLALRTTVAGRESTAEERVVGWFANEVVLRIPPRNGIVAEMLTTLRGEIFAALSDQRVPYALVDSALPHGAVHGPSCALVYLPGRLSGGEQVVHRLGNATVTRTAVSVCPTGADIDFFMIEDVPPKGDRPHALLMLGASTERRVASQATVDGLLERWLGVLTTLATCDWQRTPVPSIMAAA